MVRPVYVLKHEHWWTNEEGKETGYGSSVTRVYVDRTEAEEAVIRLVTELEEAAYNNGDENWTDWSKFSSDSTVESRTYDEQNGTKEVDRWTICSSVLIEGEEL